MPKELAPIDEAFNRLVEVAEEALERVDFALDDYNRAAKAAAAIAPGGPTPQRLVSDP